MEIQSALPLLLFATLAGAQETAVPPTRITGPSGSAPVGPREGLPLPGAARFGTTPEGDVVLEEAQGDPFFLGFAAGESRPGPDEYLDPDLVPAMVHGFDDDRPAAVTYAFAMFQERITPQRVAELEELGARVLGFHPHYCLKLALPLGSIEEVAAHPAVRWLGVPEPWQKLHPSMGERMAGAAPSEMLEVYINVFDSDLCDASTSSTSGSVARMDMSSLHVLEGEEAEAALPRVWQSNGWMQRALEQRGVLVRSYVDDLRTFRAFVPAESIEHLLPLDFVQFIEPELEAVTSHDESTAMILSDRVRSAYDGSTNEVAVVGLVDTGLDTGHSDLGIWGVGWSCVGAGAWDDSDGHGSHVASSILGRGYGESDHRGNAPGLASWGGTSRLFNVRFLNGPSSCSWSVSQVFDVMEDDYFDGASTTAKPHVVNNSWGSFLSGSPIGTEFNARVVDNQVLIYDQVYVFAAGNEGSSAGSLRIEPSAKNALTVGNVLDYRNSSVGDPGTLWTTSSRGPCGDGRFKPNLVAPGRWIRGADANTGTGYTSYSGTSMAAPHVTGVVAQLVDRWSYLRYKPHTIASLLMATAMTKDNQTLLTSSSHMDTYGAGRVEAYKAAYDNSQFSVLYNNDLTVTGSTYQFGDFTVSSNVTRLVVVMHYTETAASSGASKALINDWDLWVDQPPLESGGNTGEWFAQQTSLDNTEIRILDNPITGTWRWKAYPDSVSSTCKMSVTVHAIYGDTTPVGTFDLSADDLFVRPDDEVVLTGTATNPEYVASAVFLDSSGDPHNLQSASTVLDDGVVTDVTDNPHGGYDVTLGDILYGQSRSVVWRTRYPSEGVKEFSVSARSDNWVDRSASVQITVDGTPPSAPTTPGSSSHTAGEWSNDPTVVYTWTAATDNVAGVAGYGLRQSLGGPGAPACDLDIGPVTEHTVTYDSHALGQYLNIRSGDFCDNWATEIATAGPYFIDVDAPGEPTEIYSTSHDLNVPSCENEVVARWTAATDPHSGVAGYSTRFTHSPTSIPNDTVDTTNPAETGILASSPDPWWFHVKTLDLAGNASGVVHFGPFFVQTGSATNYCVSSANSTGSGGVMSHSGSLSVGGNTLVLECTGLPVNQPGIFFYGAGSQTSLFGNGFLCVAGQIYRMDVTYSDASGQASFPVDFGDPPVASGQITAGSLWNFQCWYRDPQGGGAFFNLSDGRAIEFCP